MEFQVLDVAVSYNLLLGRPWIHTAKVVSSTLHQMVKFEWDRQEIVVHGEENLYSHNDASVPFIDDEDDKGPWVYQVVETVPVEKVPERKCVPTPKIASASIMVASKMLKNGFVLVCDQHTYCNMVKEELDGEPWFYDIREYIRMKVYPVRATCDQKRTIWHLASGYFLSGRVLYKRTPDLGLLRCINAKKAMNIMTEVHSGVYGSHMSGYVLEK
uniref:Uncharacterized protein LOC104224325 n=1 Tax=Nicotiana sylvestris TaxID=4096 RepID=A0A1U7WJ28_NICSY|nr:PREDICTED: uncharacterized protein LOC104224325 [Nicotiana sylvestris]